MKSKTLTHREKEVLLLLACGLTEEQTANKLHLSPATVHTHRKNIYKKLNTHCLIIAIAKALHQQHFTIDNWFFLLSTLRML